MSARLVIGLALGALLLTATASGGPLAEGPTPKCNGGGCSSDWYKDTVAVSWDLPAGAVSLQACQFDTVASDTTGQSLSCSAFYSPALSVTSTVTVKRDATAPTVGSGSPARGPDSNGWYTSPVGVTFSGSDATSGIASCTSATYAGPDSSGASVSGSCTDAAGNSATGGAYSLKYDASGPSVDASAARAPDKDGWYTGPVSFSVSGSDAVSGLDSCNAPSYGGPDTGGGSVTATCRDRAGNTGSRSVSVRYDSTRPEATGAALDRAPDHGEWYTKPVTVTFAGSDSTSGIASCTSMSYSGPDGDANVSGTCTDRAGHTSAPRAFGFKYDDTAPQLTKAEVKKGDRFVTLSWAATGGVAAATVTRADLASAAAAAPMYTGTGTSYTDRSVKNGVKYSYVLRVEDAAGNAVTKTIVATPRPALYKPARDARLRRGAPTTFAWEAVPKATYYNFQLHRRVGGRWVKVLTRWPGKPWFALPRRWEAADGRMSTLTAGRYRWYVWPATGLRSQRRYGKLEGSSEFSVG